LDSAPDEEMLKPLAIRAYQARDMTQVIDVWLACNLVVPWNNPERDIERKLRVDPELFLVGEIGGRIVATCMAGYEGHRGWVNYLAVLPGLRRKGIARSMMDLAEKKLREMGCPKINVMIRKSNKDVLAFYQSIG
jgi:ribosomal protein S18 acetylase RimI-like enzyme